MYYLNNKLNVLLLTPWLPTLVSSADNSQRLGSSHSYLEVVSEPLTFEFTPEKQPDRRQLLQAEEEDVIQNDEGWVWNSSSSLEDEEGHDVSSSLTSSSFFDIDQQATSSSEDDEAEDGGMELVGEPKEAISQPIARKLRRVGAPSDITKKESFRDESIPMVEPTPLADQDDRQLGNACSGNQKYFKLDMTTDNYGFETRWELKKSSGGTVLSGPPKNSNYYDNKRYIGGICLAPDQYKFTIYDKFQDGMCKQSTGKGNYKIYLDNVQKGSSPSCGTVWGKRQHSFTVKASNNNNNNNNNSNLDEGSSRGNGCSTVKVEFKVDQYGYETKVFLRNSSGDDKLKSVNEVGPKQTKTMSACLNAGTYKFIIVDNDGIGDGYYMVLVDGKQVVKGSSFTGQIDHKIKVGYDVQSLMSTRDKEWLNAHNTKRKTFHQRAGKNYRPLRWSTELAKDALSWATQLSKTCHSTTGILHEKFIDEGENLAKNKGSGSWGNQPDATNVLKRWVDNEEGMNYPANAHLTQVIWYATEYVGCGEKSVTKNGSTCSIQVCRYARAGNCNVKNGNWKQVAYLDQTACGPLCPSDGCYK